MKGKKQKEPVGFNPAEIFAALAMLEKERGIPQTFMMDKIIQALTTAYKRDHTDVENVIVVDKIIQALTTAYKRDHTDVENVIVDVDEAHQTLRMFVQKNVVEEEDYVDPANEMLLEEAQAISAKYQVGDVVNLPVDNMEFGRIAAGNGKQVIIQGLREAERGMVYDEFNSKQHEILTGVVTRIDPRNGNVSLRIGTGTESTEALLMSGEQVPGEELTEGMHVKVYVVEVRRSADVVDVRMAEDGKACRVLVPDDQLSLAIGKEGQNARLAARLTGYKIDIKPESWQDTEEADCPAAPEAEGESLE